MVYTKEQIKADPLLITKFDSSNADLIIDVIKEDYNLFKIFTITKYF
jgi:hypothetical protein